MGVKGEILYALLLALLIQTDIQAENLISEWMINDQRNNVFQLSISKNRRVIIISHTEIVCPNWGLKDRRTFITIARVASLLQKEVFTSTGFSEHCTTSASKIKKSKTQFKTSTIILIEIYIKEYFTLKIIQTTDPNIAHPMSRGPLQCFLWNNAFDSIHLGLALTYQLQKTLTFKSLSMTWCDQRIEPDISQTCVFTCTCWNRNFSTIFYRNNFLCPGNQLSALTSFCFYA